MPSCHLNSSGHTALAVWLDYATSRPSRRARIGELASAAAEPPPDPEAAVT